MAPRTPPLNPLPADRAFTPRTAAEQEARERDKEAADAVAVDPGDYTASNADKMAAWAAQAQDMANQLNMSVLLHVSALPHHEWCGPTMRADFIPAKDDIEAPEVEPPPYAR